MNIYSLIKALSIRVIVIFGFSVVLLLGCTATHIIKNDEPFMLNKRATLVLNNNTKLGVNSLSTSKDSFIVKNIRRRLEKHFAKSEMQKLIITYRGKGALQGALIFGLTGAIYGYQSAPNNGDALGSSGASAFVSGVFIGIIGFAAGWLFLAPKDIYIFSNEKLKEGNQ